MLIAQGVFPKNCLLIAVSATECAVHLPFCEIVAKDG
jgi:hypothetical protein